MKSTRITSSTPFAPSRIGSLITEENYSTGHGTLMVDDSLTFYLGFIINLFQDPLKCHAHYCTVRYSTVLELFGNESSGPSDWH